MSDLLDYHLALNTLLETHSAIEGEESVPLASLNQRVLARDVMVQYDVPAFDNSAMDGYAICGNDCDSWEVVQRIAAGDHSEVALQPGQAARIFTGAPLPGGTTAVLMQEHVAADADSKVIKVDRSQRQEPEIEEGLNTRRRAEELQSGTVLLPASRQLTPAAVGLLSTQGY